MPVYSQIEQQKSNQSNIRYGFLLGFNKNSASLGPCFQIGTSINKCLKNNVSINLQPQVTFTAYGIDGQPLEYSIVDLPLYLNYFFTQNKIGPIFSAGISYRYIPKYSLNLFSADCLLGFKKSFDLFSVIPSIRYSYNERLKSTFYFQLVFE